MMTIERLVIEFLTLFFSREEINLFLRDAENSAIIAGVLIATSGALLGCFLLLRGMSLTSDAISHTVLLGIVLVFILMTVVLNQEPNLSSPWLIIGATMAGVATVILTEIVYRSGLVRQDAALGLVFPFLFAIAIILIAQFADDAHLDEDAVMLGNIGMVWSNTNNHCFENCETVTITPEHPKANLTRQCINCRAEGISPRDEGADFMEICTNCGTYTPGKAYQMGLVEEKPVQIFFPKAISMMGVLTILTTGFVLLFYKELKITTFDAALAKALGFRPGVMNYALMVLVSLVAVGAFDAVGSILVIAFFILPPAAAYLLTNRLSRMLMLSPLLGGAGVYTGYDLARGEFLGVISMDDVLSNVNRLTGLGLPIEWDISISASMVLMLFFFFLMAWIFSPQHGLVSTLIRRMMQRRYFNMQVVLGHIYHHQNTDTQQQELSLDTLYQHLRWSPARIRWMVQRLKMRQFIHIDQNIVKLTPRGERQIQAFRRQNFAARPENL